MKERFSTIDLFAAVEYLKRKLLGMRVANIYDIDQKTYLLKLARSEEKIMLLFESGCRIHTTEFEWPKHLHPSGFAMKLRKHLRTKRLVNITQLGIDRVIDMQFGSLEYAHHLIVELYDRGNVILTDHLYTILSLLRVRTDVDSDVKFAVRETFSMDTIKQNQPTPTIEQVTEILSSAKTGDQLKHILNPHFVYGPALLTHSLLSIGLAENAKLGTTFNTDSDTDKLLKALTEAHILFERLQTQPSQGYLIQKKDSVPSVDTPTSNDATPTTATELITNVEFHPMLFKQHESSCYKELETFDKAVDEFFSSRSGQKQDIKVIQMQKTAVKKLDNIRQDHERRIDALRKTQEEDIFKAQLIELNTDLIERACIVIRSAVANAMDWGDIELLVRDAQAAGDPVASCICGLKLHSNLITVSLKEPAGDSDDSEEESTKRKKRPNNNKGVKVDIDLGLSVYGNARRYYDQKKQAAKKEQKTFESSYKALKSAEKKTKQTLKEAAVISRVTKARKVHWFEKFFWFISSENYLVIGGRDQQQNELIVKKYLNESDVYVHADLHGATSAVIKNSQGGPVPPKTLNEAGIMAVCYSSAWEAKVTTSAWWVHANQVSKTAPTGEYLTTGSFMIRGKKNYLPPCTLTLGFSIMFKVDDSSLANHINERKVRPADDDQLSIMSEAISEVSLEEEEEEILEDEEDKEQIDQPLEEIEDEIDEEQFPDTAIHIQSRGTMGGVKLEFQRSVSATTDTSEILLDKSEEKEESIRHKHMSAKERRMLKKKMKGHSLGGDRIALEPPPPSTHKSIKPAAGEPCPQSQTQYKRGQKSKQKKIRDKYGDQDEEEREKRMEILASSGPSKEVKGKRGRNKKGDLGQSFNPKAKYHHKERNQSIIANQKHKQDAPVIKIVEDTPTETVDDDSIDPKTSDTNQTVTDTTDTTDTVGIVNPISDTVEVTEEVMDDDEQVVNDEVVDNESDEEERKALLAEENLLLIEETKKDSFMLDSLTGTPLTGDVLLYAVPVCAPYSAILNYKYKVKLVPGTNRRGKAAKTAVHKFIQSKDTSQLEKDLLRSIKDNDLSRYFPGKVKMTLPQQAFRTKH